MSERSVLLIQYKPVSELRKLRAGVGRFLRYIQYRDQHEREESDPELSKLLKYVHHRDRTAPKGRLFDGRGRAGDLERRQLEQYVPRSVRGLEPRLRRDAEGHLTDRQRAFYQMLLSPENAAGLDLQRLIRTVMADLEREVGHPLPPWLGAEHRNTDHPHVHIVMAARRELDQGRFRTLIVTRRRLASMKDSMNREIERQRELERSRDARTLDAAYQPPSQPMIRQRTRETGRPRRRDGRPTESMPRRDVRQRLRQRARHIGSPSPRISHVLRRLALAYQREAEREEREREREERQWS